jgi:putative ABC transport system permease protein
MKALRRAMGGLRSLFRRNREEQELDEELHGYLDMSAEHKISAGMSSDDAMRSARVEFGSLDAVKEQVRDVGWESFVETLWQDIRFAARTMTKEPSFTAVAVLTLALGIGATTAIFSIVSAVLWQPLPYPNAARIAQIIENVPAEESMSGRAMRLPSMSPEEFNWWRQNVRVLAAMAVSMPDTRTVLTADGAVRLTGQRVSPSLFSIRSVQPVLGRGLYADEERPDANVVVLSADIWRRYFGSDPEIINRAVALSGQTYTVVGVMPPEFGDQAYWTPYAVAPSRLGATELVRVTALLREGISLEAATAEVNSLGAQLRGGAAGPGGTPRFEVVLEQAQMVASVRPALRVLVVAVIVVLLIVCANMTNLLLVRGAARHREIGIRRALGAARGRVVRQLLTEGLVLSLAGAVLGTLLAYGGVQLIKTISVIELPSRFRNAPGLMASTILPRADQVKLDPTVFAFALGLSLLTGLIFALAPAFRLSRSDHRRAISAAGFATRGGMPSRAGNRTGYFLAVVQLGLATTLLIGGGLLFHSFLKLSSLFLGFDPDTQIFQVVSPREHLRSRKLALGYDVSARLSALPGVEAAGLASAQPLQQAGGPGGLYLPPDWESQRNSLDDEYRSAVRGVSPGYLQAMGVRLLEGRWLNEDDAPGRPQVILVNRAWVERFSPGKSPIGTNVVFVTTGRIKRPITWQIVGVIENVRLRMDGGMDSQPNPKLPLLGFVELRQFLTSPNPDIDRVSPDLDMDELAGGYGFAVRRNGDPLSFADLRRVVRELEPAAAVESLATMGDVVSGIIARQRFYTVVVGVFAAIAGLIAAIGIYGVLAYAMTQRTQEFGIRLALGARPRKVLGLVLGHGVMLVMIGVGFGVAGALAITRYLSSMLFGLTALDPLTYVAVAALFTAVALIASYVPARRATKVDPLVALRYE